MTTKKETDQQILDLERWLKGVPLEEQRMIECVCTVIHLAKLYNKSKP